MTTKYVNTSGYTRAWTGLKAEDGSTLSLDPGEEVELELPEDFEDEHLKPVEAAPAPPPAASAPTPATDDAPASAN